MTLKGLTNWIVFSSRGTAYDNDMSEYKANESI